MPVSVRQPLQGPSHILQRLETYLRTTALKHQDFSGLLLQDRHKTLLKSLISNYFRVSPQQSDIWIQASRSKTIKFKISVTISTYQGGVFFISTFTEDIHLEGGSITLRNIYQESRKLKQWEDKTISLTK